ncbi:MAG: DUF3883 domain-containing protein [Proteobacteria bacterium]|nr:DUF3883 domain-containing protein [Pseudomonadota bacterium]
MRVIKLSDKDNRARTEEGMHEFLTKTVRNREPEGKFYTGTNGKIASEKLDVGELLIFTYQSKIVYFAHVASGVVQGNPSYFCINIDTLKRCKDGILKTEFEKRINVNLSGQGWNRVEGRDEEIKEILLKEFLHETEASKEDNKPNKIGGGWSNKPNVEENRQIEDRAVAKVTEYYESKEYEVKSVETENVGWDLDVSKNGEILHVEVKGHKGDVIQFELTPNEYEQMQVQKKYRVCVVCQALDESPRLIELFPVLDDKWTLQTKDGKKIVELEERTAARVIRQP